MKYGETSFCIIYLVFAIFFGILILVKHKSKATLLMGIATLILGIGDSFHLVPRMLNYFIDANFNKYLGIGKLVTSITMTAFYVLMYHIVYDKEKINQNKLLTFSIYGLALIRCGLCAFPQNGWLTNDGDYLWGIIRNVPFVILGIIIIVLFYQNREKYNFKYFWLYITLSFAFYLVTVIGASFVPILGMFMLPKTICYMIMVYKFYKCVEKENK